MMFTLDEIVGITGATLVRSPSAGRFRVTHLVDSVGPDTLFFPMGRGLIGESTMNYIARRGCAGVALYDTEDSRPALAEVRMTVLKLPDPNQGYYALARAARRRSRALIIGVTGSSGKSSTKEYIASILRLRYRVHATRGTENLCSDCAGILLEMDGTADEAAVIEMGFGWAGDIGRMAEVARPFAAVITLIAPDHLDGVGSDFAALIREKGQIAKYLPPQGVLAVNGDDHGCLRLDLDACSAHIARFGTSRDAFVGYRVLDVSEAGTKCLIRLPIDTMTCNLRPVGEHQAANAAAASVIAHWLGFAPSEIRTGLEGTAPLPRRFHVHRFGDGITIIDDTFSATYEAARHGLATAARLAGQRRRVAVLTGIAQLAASSAELHQAIGRTVVEHGYSHLVLALTDDRTDWIKRGALAAGLDPACITEVHDRRNLPTALLELTTPFTLLYCKGSMYLRIWPEVDAFLSALRHRNADR